MNIKVMALLLILTSAVLSAQLVTPTAGAKFTWEHDGLLTDHYEVRYPPSQTAWVSVGKVLTATLPALPVGSYTAEVRACAAAAPTTDTCAAATMAFTVAAPAPTAPSAPRNLKLAASVPTPPTTAVNFYLTNFSTGTPAPLSVYAYGGGACASSTDFVDTNTNSSHSLKCTVPRGTGAAALQAWFGTDALSAFPKDPTLDKDLYIEHKFVIGAGSIAAAGGQIKLHKSVYGQAGSNVNGWTMVTYTPSSGEGMMMEPELWTNNLNPNPPFTTAAMPHFAEGVVYDVYYHYRRNSATNCGVAEMWVNGNKRFSTPCQAFLGAGGGNNSAGLVLWDGATYMQDGVGTYTVYNLFIRATNYAIGPAIS